MNLTLDLITIPTFITIVLIIVMCRPYERRGAYDFGLLFRLFWLIPILSVWVIYLGVTR